MSGSGWDTRLEKWFKDRHWRVRAELDGTARLGEVSITYRRGVFDIEPPGVFVSPFGTSARHGVVIVEMDGFRDVPGSSASFGEPVLRRAQEAYGTIRGLPEPDSGSEESSGG